MKNNPYLIEAMRIGDQIVESAHEEKKGISWITPLQGINKNATWSKQTNIYSGSCGIVLFLLSLYEVTGKDVYVEACIKAMSWVLSTYTTTYTTNALITGKMGIVYTLFRLYEVTKKKRYMRTALDIARECRLSQENLPVYDFINGISGTLFGLLYLHALTNETWILTYINEYTECLLRNAQVRKTGIFWDEYPQEIRPLCGFAHGTSGIGFTFLELGKYLKNPIFFEVSKQAFSYEDFFYDKKMENWPDFRVPIWTNEDIAYYEAAHKEGNDRVFMIPHNMNAWCHGATGIGMVRLRSEDICGDSLLKKDIIKAQLRATKSTGKFLGYDKKLFTLCHGELGIAEFFLEYSVRDNNAHHLHIAKEFADDAFQQKKLLGYYCTETVDREDVSLFNGIAGIGYFFLRLCYPTKIQSILLPQIPIQQSKKACLFQKDYPYLALDRSALNRALLSSNFSQTIDFLDKYKQEQLKEYLETHNTDAGQSIVFKKFIKSITKELVGKERAMIKEIFAREEKKRDLLENILYENKVENSTAWQYIHETLHMKIAKKLLAMPLETLLSQPLKLSPHTYLFSSPHEEATVFKKTYYRTEEIPITQFCYMVLSLFKKRRKVRTSIAQLKKGLQVLSIREEDLVAEKTIAQIKEGIQYGILEK